jgi:transcription antitermination protein NusB
MISHSLPQLTPNVGDKAGTHAALEAAKPSNRGARRRSRECVVQGLYTWLVNHERDSAALSAGSSGVIEAYLRGGDEFAHCDLDLFKQLLHGVIEHAVQLREIFSQHIDRKPSDLSPVEHSLLLLGTYELVFCLEMPLRVIINEAVEVSKLYGGNDAYKYINGVLDKVAAGARPVEFAKNKQDKLDKKNR